MPGRTSANSSISTGLLRTSLRRSATLRSGLATIATICARDKGSPSVPLGTGSGPAQAAASEAAVTT